MSQNVIAPDSRSTYRRPFADGSAPPSGTFLRVGAPAVAACVAGGVVVAVVGVGVEEGVAVATAVDVAVGSGCLLPHAAPRATSTVAAMLINSRERNVLTESITVR
jgi:hypothetical protein